MKKLFLLLAASAVVLLLSCDPVNKDNPDLPENYDIEFVANEVEALAIPPLAAGWLLDIETDYHILTLNMSDNGYDSFGMEKPNSTYFIVGFFYDVPDDGSDVITVADGTYEYVPGGVAAGNIVIEICSYTKTGELSETVMSNILRTCTIRMPRLQYLPREILRSLILSRLWKTGARCMPCIPEMSILTRWTYRQCSLWGGL